MNISELASAAAEALADRESTGKAVTSVACRWPRSVTADGDYPQVGHTCRITD